MANRCISSGSSICSQEGKRGAGGHGAYGSIIWTRASNWFVGAGDGVLYAIKSSGWFVEEVSGELAILLRVVGTGHKPNRALETAFTTPTLPWKALNTANVNKRAWLLCKVSLGEE